MKSNFDRALKAVLVHEGGYVNHPADPGGATNKGVTQATYNAYRRAKRRSTQSVRSISGAEVADIYKSRYWDAVKGDDLPSGLDYCVFDFGVNSGPSRAIKFMQRQIGTDADGVIGPKTMKAVARADTVAAISGICDRRLSWLKTLRHWGTFGRGWSRRVVGVEKMALELAHLREPPPLIIPPDPAPNIDEDTLAPVTQPASGGFFYWLRAFLRMFSRTSP